MIRCLHECSKVVARCLMTCRGLLEVFGRLVATMKARCVVSVLKDLGAVCGEVDETLLTMMC
jgi:hypothetical protein